ncbi:MAG TPA: Gfo/Idh/MocA family oxidoreductase [Candidatus Hydrogenedentes bacterium]|nr:Gfo/Idh/MocA family oxidoreductase [Candidatus Hydrogenedentota bacterium]HOM47030.1 Gfo/Idh/MocA family oxidoreductase [Candidatus Hydrogenedentota bacterium]HOR49708.1 Gfo/Idh/MocA family oxidoreductase [Candidatus Hydrogenedentota bacterium]HPK23862.1 Gfo/Idh/MocA family oxidoreductase [Candidatus Hydrogenedentota bacterium]
MSPFLLTRRAFIASATTSVLATGAFAARPNTARVVPGKLSPNEKLNVAGIGAGGKGTQDILSFQRENIVALCDVDAGRAAEAFYRVPEARQFQDYRKMFDEMGSEIDMVTISTPDHTHAPAAYRAMKLGKHVYVQKPLTHTVAEARLLTRTAREMGVATQMGNQGHSGDGVRDLAEMLWSGVIGTVSEVHVWTDRPGSRWPQGEPTALPPAEPVPEGLNWDLWLGAAPWREFNGLYAPFKWRGWWDFGCGGLGDMACHVMDPAFFALKLGEAPSFTVEPVRMESANGQTYPKNIILKYAFPARADMPPVDLYWYENGLMPPRPEGIPEGDVLGDKQNGSLFIGSKGFLTAGEYGGNARLLPDSIMADYKKPDQTLPRVSGANHYRNFLDACKGNAPAVSNFDYAGPFTEMVLLGNVALRLNKAISFSTESMQITNDAAAQTLLTKPYRAGWELPV